MTGLSNKQIGAAVAVAVLIALAVAARMGLGEVDAARALAVLRRVQGEWWALPAYLACYVALTTAFLPAGLLHMAVGAAYGFSRGIWINLAAFNATALLQFAVARRIGREQVAAFLARRGITRVEALTRDHGLLSAILIRFLPIPAVGVAAGMGVSAVRPRDYALGSLLGGLPVVAVYTYFASALVEGAAGVEREARWRAVAAIAAALVLVLATGLIRARVRRRTGRD